MTVARIVVFGSRGWSDRRLTRAALVELEELFLGPNTLVAEVDSERGPGRYAVAAATGRPGWNVDLYKIDPDCDMTTCTPGHRKKSADPMVETFCPTASRRAYVRHLDKAHAVLFLLRQEGDHTDLSRLGQREARDRGLYICEYRQPARPTRSVG
jgi:hypothetical protein